MGCASTVSLLLLLASVTLTGSPPTRGQMELARQQRKEALLMARDALVQAGDWARASMGLDKATSQACDKIAWADCAKLYEGAEERIRRLAAAAAAEGEERYGPSDARMWLGAAMAGDATCMEGLLERNLTTVLGTGRWNVTALLGRALAMHALPTDYEPEPHDRQAETKSAALDAGLLATWDASAGRADVVVAQDGSGDHRTIGGAVNALGLKQSGDRRLVIYVKSGLYKEYVEIDWKMKNVMFVGDGIDKTTVSGDRNVPDGHTTYSSATFGVSGDGFWARDMTFENTAGPEKHQAVALRVGSDHAVFYRCGFRGYQDTLFVHSQRQFYRECQIYGTVDFIFGNAAVVLQDCDIFVRRPMRRQANMITAQGRDDPNQSTGISVHGSRVRPAPDFAPVKGSFDSYLGRPWKKYSRTVFMETDLDGLVHPDGWAKWSGDFALDTLYYGEYMNTGDGASTAKRVNWPGFHVLRDARDAAPFTVGSFIQGQSWIPETGVPFWPGL